jgi:hypothetical protein
VAAGSGRHALRLAAAGLRVDAVDHDVGRLAAIEAAAARLGLEVTTRAIDLEAAGADLGRACYDLVLVVRFLHRPLFAALTAALARGGLLLYETFTVHQAARGRPTNPAHLLDPGELADLVAPLTILRRREGEYDGHFVSAVAARAL